MTPPSRQPRRSPVRDRPQHTFGEHSYRVVSRTHATSVISDLTLAPQDEGLTHRAGQYLLLTDPEHRLPERSYSIANAPRADRRLRLLVTRYEDGRTSTWASSLLQPGETVTVSGPFGTLTLDEDRPRSTPVLLLAAGAGLAPLAALADQLLQDDGGPVTLLASARTKADLIDHDRYLRLARGHPRFDYHPVLTRPVGRSRATRLPQRLPGLVPQEGLADWDVFVAGPSGFVSAAQRAAVALGAAPEAVRTEEFFADPTPSSGSPGAASSAVSA